MVNHGLAAKLTAGCFRTKNSFLHCQQEVFAIM